MTTHLFRSLAFTASVCFPLLLQLQSLSAGASENSYLAPVNEDRETREPEASYKEAVEQNLFLTPGDIARVIRLPGTVGVETVVAVYRQQASQQSEYWVTVTQPSKSLWNPENKSGEGVSKSTTILRLDAGLPETTALAVQKVWRAMLLGVRESPESDEILLESSTQIFSAAGPDGQLLRGQLEGVGEGNTAVLSDLVDLLLAYCDTPETRRVEIAHKIEQAAADLLGRVASATGDGSDVQNQDKAHSRKLRSNVSNLPTSRSVAIISNATRPLPVRVATVMQLLSAGPGPLQRRIADLPACVLPSLRRWYEKPFVFIEEGHDFPKLQDIRRAGDGQFRLLFFSELKDAHFVLCFEDHTSLGITHRAVIFRRAGSKCSIVLDFAFDLPLNSLEQLRVAINTQKSGQ